MKTNFSLLPMFLCFTCTTLACGGTADSDPSEMDSQAPTARSPNGSDVVPSAQDNRPVCNLESCETSVKKPCMDHVATTERNCSKCWSLCGDPYAPSSCPSTCDRICHSASESECDDRYDSCAASTIRDSNCRIAPRDASSAPCGAFKYDRTKSLMENANDFGARQDDSTCKTCLTGHKVDAACAESKCGPLWDVLSACGDDTTCQESATEAVVNCWLTEHTSPNNPKCYRATTQCYVLE